MTAAADPPKRGRGRPAVGGEPRTIRINDAQRAVAEQLGAGNLNAGVRFALDWMATELARYGARSVAARAAKLKSGL